MFNVNQSMGIKEFFSKAWGKVKNAARVGFNFVKDKVIPNVGRIAKVGMNIMSKLPGKLGAIGSVGSHIINTVDKAVDYIPNQRIRDKIRSGLGWASGKVSGGIEKATDIINKGNDLIDRGKGMYDTIKGGISTLPVKPSLKDMLK